MAFVYYNNGRNLGILSIGHGERVIDTCMHKSEQIKGIKGNEQEYNHKGITGACMTKNNAF